MRQFFKDVLKSAIARAVAIGIVALALFIWSRPIALIWSWLTTEAGAALLSPVPAQYVVVAALGGIALVLGAWWLRDQRASHAKRARQAKGTIPLTEKEERLLVFLQHAGSRGAPYKKAQQHIELNDSQFDVLIHRLGGWLLSDTGERDYNPYSRTRMLTITGAGKDLLAHLEKQDPGLLA